MARVPCNEGKCESMLKRGPKPSIQGDFGLTSSQVIIYLSILW